MIRVHLILPWLVLYSLNEVRAASRALQETDIDYFDRLRQEPSLLQGEALAGDRNESNVFSLTDQQGKNYRLIEIAGFLPFSDSSGVRARVENSALAAMLATYHFNNPDSSPILDSQQLKDCNVRMTTELFDTQFSPIDSTRLFTDVLQRNHSLKTPIPTAVVGAYRSATTSPLAILTGVNGIPQVSYASSSTDFEVKEQYPLFGRTIESSDGEARIAVEYFRNLGATHVGILFVTDAYGSALQKAFQDAAAEVNITTSSVAFSYSADLDGPEIPNAVESLDSTQYRFIYAVCFEQHYNPIMTAAHKREMTGGDYLWVFPAFDIYLFQRNAVYPPGSPLAEATRGVAFVPITGGFLPEIVPPEADAQVSPLEEPPSTGYQKLRTSWRQALEDPDALAYVRSKIPESVQNVPGFDPNASFAMEPNQIGPHLYDAITALGLAACSAGDDDEFFNGTAIFEYFRNLDFEGTSGRVLITPETGTRNYTTMTHVLWNAQDYPKLDAQGRVQFQLAPTNYYQNGKWHKVPNMTYVYGDGGTTVPESLPPVEMDMNFIGKTGRIVGYTLMGIVMFFALASFPWLLWYHKHPVVSSSQPLFLLMISVGSMVMAATIIPMSFEETITTNEETLDRACVATPWLYVSGAVIALSALLAKTRGIHMAYVNPELDFIRCTPRDIFLTFGVVYAINLIVLICWTVIHPLEWNRAFRDSTDIFDRYVESYGLCSNGDSLPFVIVILVFNILVLVLANWWAYESRNIETEYHESRYIGISMAAVLQAWCMGIPILIVVWDNPAAKFFVEAGIVFVTSLAVLLLIYIPKVLAIRADRIRSRQEAKRTAFERYTDRSRRGQMADVDDEDDEEKSGKGKDNSGDFVVVAAAAAPLKDSHPKDSASTGTTANTHASDGNKPAAEENGDAGPEDIGNDSSAADVVAALPAIVGAPSSPPGSPRRSSSFVRSLSARLTPTSSNGSMERRESGIKIIHNPRSQSLRQSNGGRELSPNGINESLDDDDENGIPVVEEEGSSEPHSAEPSTEEVEQIQATARRMSQ